MKQSATLLLLFFVATHSYSQKTYSKKKIETLKNEVIQKVESKAKLAQVMNDMIFSFAELGFQEFETSNYITSVLEENGFEIQRDISGIPTAWVAKWGSGKPVIAIGSDIDCIPKASLNSGPKH